MSPWRAYLKDSIHIREDPGRERALSLCRAMIAWLKDTDAKPPVDLIDKALRTRSKDARFLAARALGDLAARGHADLAINVFQTVSIAAAQDILRYFPRAAEGPSAARPAVSVHRDKADPTISLITLALRHRSPEVRRDAISSAYWQCPDHFNALMASKPKTQTTPGEAEHIEEYAALLKDGYHARFISTTWSWDIHYRDGTGIASADVPKLVIDTIGFEAALKHIRRHAKKTGNVPWDEIVEGA